MQAGWRMLPRSTRGLSASYTHARTGGQVENVMPPAAKNNERLNDTNRYE